MQKTNRLLLAIWFGFFGAFLIGASWKSLNHYPVDRLMGHAMMVYGLLYFAYYPVAAGRRLLKLYGLLMLLAAAAMSSRMAYVAVKRPGAYRGWDDWLLLAFMLAGFWSLLPALWKERSASARAA